MAFGAIAVGLLLRLAEALPEGALLRRLLVLAHVGSKRWCAGGGEGWGKLDRMGKQQVAIGTAKVAANAPKTLASAQRRGSCRGRERCRAAGRRVGTGTQQGSVEGGRWRVDGGRWTANGFTGGEPAGDDGPSRRDDGALWPLDVFRGSHGDATC